LCCRSGGSKPHVGWFSEPPLKIDATYDVPLEVIYS
jgi:hypothetical protein